MTPKNERALEIMREAFTEAAWESEERLRLQRGEYEVEVNILTGMETSELGQIFIHLTLPDDLLPMQMRVASAAMANFRDDGLTRVPSGDPAFDAKYAVHGGPAFMVKPACTALRAALSVPMEPPLEVDLSYWQINTLVPHEDATAERLHRIVDVLVQLAGALVAANQAKTSTLSPDERAALERQLRKQFQGESSWGMIAGVAAVVVLLLAGAAAAWMMM